MKLRNKILFAIWGVVLGLLIVLYVITDSAMRSQIQSRFTDDLRGNYRILAELNALRSQQDIRACQIIAESPRLKAVVELGDRKTTLQLSHELAGGIRSDLFVVTDTAGRAVAYVSGGDPPSVPRGPAPIRRALAGETFADAFRLDTAAYRCATTPLTAGAEIVGTLTLGYRIGREDLQAVSAMTNSDVVLVADSGALASTMPAHMQPELDGWLRAHAREHFDIASPLGAEVFTVSLPSDNFVATLCRVDNEKSRMLPAISYLLLKPIDREVRSALEPIMDIFIIVSVAVLAITGAIGYIISRGITRPIASLVRGTAEIARGNYDYHIDIRSGEEMGYLADQFERMSASLKGKIRELAEQNAALEEALRRLKETQQELVKSERLAARGQLTAQLSHEINNPIHNIQSCLQTVLRRTGGQPAERELLAVALEEVERLAKLTRQMLDMYRTSVVQEPREPVCLNDVIRDVLASSGQNLKENGVAVETNLADRLPAISGSPDKLKQVFLNLIINARDAMNRGGTLTISTLRQNGNAVATVADTGVGIPQENMTRIFEAFFTTKSKVSGVGLGLAVTYGIVQQHNGTIHVASTVGRGTTFTLSFPVES